MNNSRYKFRAWCKKRKMMIHDIAVGDGFCGVQWEDDINYYYSSHDADLIPMQFIGLSDKNKKEIYVGDRVKAGGRVVFSNPKVTKDSIREIYSMPSGFTGVRVDSEFDKEYPSSIDNWDNYTLWNVQDDIEVIGNRFENPELLERKE